MVFEAVLKTVVVEVLDHKQAFFTYSDNNLKDILLQGSKSGQEKAISSFCPSCNMGVLHSRIIGSKIRPTLGQSRVILSQV